ncbi:MAG: DUF2079 domain-containing protein [Candidatus Omnitrophica bacterium]|nr:DUF2079 domain-containing protein [Candidatus Omnitrophota bacterium]
MSGPDRRIHPRHPESADRIAFALCAIVFFVWLQILTNKFVYFGYYDWDLAIYANAMWNLAHGSFHSSLFGTNFLTNHAEYFSFLLVPVYLIFSSAFTLIVLKLFSFVAGSFVLYLVAKRILGFPVAILLMLMYQFHPANLFMLIYEFHFESLATIFIFLMFYYFFKERLALFLASAFFATLVKENISLVVFMFGIYAVFTKRPRKAAWVTGPLILGGGVFILTMFVITPHLRVLEGIPTANQYIGMYWNHQDATVPLTEALGQNLLAVWRNFSSPLNRDFMIQLFGAFGILPFLSPHILFLGLPVFFQNFLASAWQMHTIYYHYAATIMSFVFLAAMTSLGELKKRFRPVFYQLILIFFSAAYFVQMVVYLPLLEGRMAQWQDRLDPVRWQMVGAVPPGASVVATFDFLDKLANRKDIYPFYNVWNDNNPFTGESPYRLPRNVSLALIDWECRWLWGTIYETDRSRTQAILKRSSDFYFSEDWRVKKAAEDIVLLEKGGGERLPKLLEVSAAPAAGVFPDPPVSIDGRFSLLDLAMDRPDGTVPLTFFWRAEEDVGDLYRLTIILKKEGKPVFSWAHYPGYGAYATPLWKKGDYIKERYWLLLPALSSGEYALFISLANMTTHQGAQLTYQGRSGNAIPAATFRVSPRKEVQ